MAKAAHRTIIKMSGTSTAMVSEAMSLLTGTTYRITSLFRRVLDPLVAVSVFDGGVLVPSSGYALSTLFGTVTFAVAPTGAVTITANYLPMWQLGCARSFSISNSKTILDATCFDGPGSRKKKGGLIDGTVSIGHLDTATLADDFDTGADTLTFFDSWNADTPKLVEIRPGGDATEVFRGWYILPTISVDAELDGLVETSVELELAAQAGFVYYGWGAA